MKNAEIIKAYKERQALVLKIVKQYQPIKPKELAAKVGCNPKTMSSIIARMIGLKKLTRNEGSTKRNFKVRLTRPEDLGHTPPTEQVERFKPTGIWTGMDWNPDVARPGASDFLKCPTRIGDKRFAYRTPIYGAAPSQVAE
jgi:hypothetical protein